MRVSRPTATATVAKVYATGGVVAVVVPPAAAVADAWAVAWTRCVLDNVKAARCLVLGDLTAEELRKGGSLADESPPCVRILATATGHTIAAQLAAVMPYSATLRAPSAVTGLAAAILAHVCRPRRNGHRRRAWRVSPFRSL